MEKLRTFVSQYPTLWETLKLIMTAAVTFMVVSTVLRLEKQVSDRLIGKRKRINLRFMENIARFTLIFLSVEWVVMSSPITQNFGSVLFRGTAVIAAIAGFAAQPVISDIICGLMLSAAKPFNIGDRIELEDGTYGVVLDITLRHVTLRGIDTVVRVIPNSRLNAMKITNMSWKSHRCSMYMRFGVGYGTDVRRAMAVIGRAVRDSDWTVPGKQSEAGLLYSPVYFLEYGDSSLVMGTMVYFDAATPAEVVRSDVNTRVKIALEQNGIEIPYPYVHVVTDSGRAQSGREE